MNTALILPASALASMTAYDLDSDAAGEYIEQLTVPAYEYFKTPLRAASDAAITSSVFANLGTRMFTGTHPQASSDLSDAPTDPRTLTDVQAS